MVRWKLGNHDVISHRVFKVVLCLCRDRIDKFASCFLLALLESLTRV